MRLAPSRDTARRRNPLHSDSSTPTVEGGHAPPPSRRRGVLPTLVPLGLLEPGAANVARRVLRVPGQKCTGTCSSSSGILPWISHPPRPLLSYSDRSHVDRPHRQPTWMCSRSDR